MRLNDLMGPFLGGQNRPSGLHRMGEPYVAADDAVVADVGVAAEDGGSPVAIGFRAKKANGKYRYFWLYRVVFGIPATNLATKGDSITFSTPTIEGTVLRRNKADTRGKHPWKAEVTEGDNATATTITNWYKEVYEPTYTTSGTGGSN